MALSRKAKAAACKKWKKENPDKVREGKARWLKANPTYSHKYYLKNKKKILSATNLYRKNNKEKKNEMQRNWRKGHPEHELKHIKHRAKRRGLPFDLTTDWFLKRLSAGKCEVTGLPFVFDHRGPWVPSIDMTDNHRGYTKDNCKLVCWIYNRAKCDSTHAEVIALAKALLKRR